MARDKKSFFERLTGSIKLDNEEEFEDETLPVRQQEPRRPQQQANEREWIGEESAIEGELSVDVYQTPNDIIIKTMVAGVRPEDLDISITRDMVTVKGHREETREVGEGDYFHKELYWGAFSRTVLLPEEVDTEVAEAIDKHGLLTIKLPKINKQKQTKLRVKVN
jgi:HSP20 family protein